MPVTVMLMIRRKEGITPEAFRRGYEEGHSKLAKRLFGHLWLEYRRSYLGAANSFAAEAGTPAASGAAQGDAPFDVVTEMVFRDRAALDEMNRIAAQPENLRLLSEDEERLFDRANCWTSVCDVVEEDLRGTLEP